MTTCCLLWIFFPSMWTLVACLVWQPAVCYEFPFFAGEHLLHVWFGNLLSVRNFLSQLVNTCCMFGMATYCLLRISFPSWWTLVACLVWQPAVCYEFPFLAGQHLLHVWYGNLLSVLNFLSLAVEITSHKAHIPFVSHTKFRPSGTEMLREGVRRASKENCRLCKIVAEIMLGFHHTFMYRLNEGPETRADIQ